MNSIKIYSLLTLSVCILFLGGQPPSVAADSAKISKDDKILTSLIDGVHTANTDRQELKKLNAILHSKDKKLKERAFLTESLCLLEFFEDPAAALESATSVFDGSERRRIQEYIRKTKDKKNRTDANTKEFLILMCKPGKWGKNIQPYAVALFALSQLGLQTEAAGAMNDLLAKTTGFDSIVVLLFAGDMKMAGCDYESAFSFYDLALRRAKYKLRPESEGSPEGETRDCFKEAFAKFIEHKRTEAKNFIDTQKLGFGYLLFKEAETARRLNSDFLTALIVYGEILSSPGNGIEPIPAKTEFGEAAKAYRLKCLLALSSDNAVKDAKATLANLEKNLESIRNSLKVAQKSGAGKSIQERLGKRIEALSARLKEAQKVPVGDKAAKLAFAEADQLFSGQRPSLYKGELLIDLGDYLMEKGLSLDEAASHFQEASVFFDDAMTWKTASNLLKVLPDAEAKSAPPRSERKKDRWGNILSSEVEPGQLFNQRTCSWYLSYFKKEAVFRAGFVSFFKRDFQAARSIWDGLAEIDPFILETEKMGFGSARQRLVWNIDNNNGCLFATTAEMKTFKYPKIRLAVMLADLAFEKEDRKKAIKSYDELLSGSFGKLSKDELAYVLFAKGVCLAWLKGSDAALKHFDENYASIKGTPSEPRALLAMAGRSRSSNTKEGLRKSIEYSESLIRKYPKSEQALDAIYFSATCHFALGDDKKARQKFSDYIEKKKTGGYVAFAKKHLIEIESKT